MEAKLLGSQLSPAISTITSSNLSKFTVPFATPTWKNSNYRVVSISGFPKNGIQSIQPCAAIGWRNAGRIDESETKDLLDRARSCLIRQEESIIFSLVERAQYCYNEDTYDPKAFFMDGFQGSLFDFMLQETEKIQAKVGRYKNRDEHPFFPNDLPEHMLLPSQYPQVLHPCADSININHKIREMYFEYLLPELFKKGNNGEVKKENDGHCGSTAACDIICLQALSKRIHYGKYIAEVKFLESKSDYEAAIKAKDKDELMDFLTDKDVEKKVIERVNMKAKTYGPVCKLKPKVVVDLYGEKIMDLTKEVEVEYLLRRLD